ncbi:conserved hypothetical protein [Ricinus communis]|uniref:Uncharacterized protein n=1 Tax=Ricinus communis TaxID=3988 RepID=B9S730_RICCO|nr:conserved hypothetical protein [Ricinus communis]
MKTLSPVLACRSSSLTFTIAYRPPRHARNLHRLQPNPSLSPLSTIFVVIIAFNNVCRHHCLHCRRATTVIV